MNTDEVTWDFFVHNWQWIFHQLPWFPLQILIPPTTQKASSISWGQHNKSNSGWQTKKTHLHQKKNWKENKQPYNLSSNFYVTLKMEFIQNNVYNCHLSKKNLK
jgi:hypothetical protein